MRAAFARTVLGAAVAVAACANPSYDDAADGPASDVGDQGDVPDDAPDPADGGEGDAAPVDDGSVDRPWTPPTDSLVYVNTRATLYAIDPGESLDLVPVADFSGPCTGGSGLYDIALDGDGNLVGIAAEGLYSVDRDTAACTMMRAFPADAPHFFSLSYVKGGDPDAPDAEALFAASVEEGEWVRIDPAGTTLAEIFEHVGRYDPPDNRYVSSGDIVSIEVGPGEFRTFATLKCATGYADPGCESDWLAEIDPVTGDARLVGQTGFAQMFGLGFWGDRVYGFTNGGAYVLVDVVTGRGELQRSFGDLRFWGAGTTTRPYVFI